MVIQIVGPAAQTNSSNCTMALASALHTHICKSSERGGKKTDIENETE